MKRLLCGLLIVAVISLYVGCINYGIVDNKFRTNCFGNIIPCTTSTYDLGTPTVTWANVYADTVTQNAGYYYNANTYISRDGAGNLIFNDVISGTQTLAALVGGGGAGNVTGTGTANRIVYWTTATNIADCNIYFNIANGRYGIAATNPEAVFHIHDGSGQIQLQLSYTTGLLYSNISCNQFGYLLLMPSGLRVGINNLNPNYSLDVTGTAHATQRISSDTDVSATNNVIAGDNLSVTHHADIGGMLCLYDNATIKTDTASPRDLALITGTAKTLVFDTVILDDLRVPATTTKLGGTKDPGFSVFTTNGAGSQGVFLYWFDSGIEEEVYCVVQLPHSYKLNTTIVPHVHWTPKITADGTPANQVVRWGLEYVWADTGQSFGNTVIVYGSTHTPADANVVAGKSYYTAFTTITPSASQGQGLSSMLICRVFRDATSPTDNYEHDAGLLEFDMHFGLDTVGSRTETTK